MKKYRLDKEEKEILEAVESGAWTVAVPKKSELQYYAKIASDTLKKDQRMNIRISKFDLSGIRARAAREGIPYQTLVASIIHKYVTGALRVA